MQHVTYHLSQHNTTITDNHAHPTQVTVQVSQRTSVDDQLNTADTKFEIEVSMKLLNNTGVSVHYNYNRYASRSRQWGHTWVKQAMRVVEAEVNKVVICLP